LWVNLSGGDGFYPAEVIVVAKSVKTSSVSNSKPGKIKVRLCIDCGQPVSPKALRCARCAAIERGKDPEYRKKQREVQQRVWSDADRRQARTEALRSPEVRQKISDGVERAWRDEAFRSHQEQVRKDQWGDEKYRQKVLDGLHSPENRQMRSELQRAAQGTPEARQRSAEAGKARWRDPAFRERMLQVFRSPAYRQRTAEMSNRLWQNQEHRRRTGKLSRARRRAVWSAEAGSDGEN
jgi:hypothetical protein